MKPYRWADPPNHQAGSEAPVVNPFVGPSVATRYAEVRPGLHDRVVGVPVMEIGGDGERLRPGGSWPAAIEAV